MYFKYKKKK